MAKRREYFTRWADTANWLQWRPDWPIARWVAIVAAALSALIAAIACAQPIVTRSQTVNVYIAVENPLKPLIVAVAALQIWCLLTPRAHAAAQRWFGLSLWRILLWVGAVESGILAIVGIAATNLGLECASIWSFPNPPAMATISFLSCVFALSRNNPLLHLHEMMQRCVTQWKRWNWRGRTVLVMLCVNILLTGNYLIGYWQHASRMFADRNPLMACKCDDEGNAVSDFDVFLRRCRKEIPAGARVLYHGPNYGQLLAYEIYPSRVFMLPQEQKDMFHFAWREEKWCKGMAADPLDHFWKWDPPLTPVSEEQFIAEHQITCVVTYDDLSVANNSIRDLR
jgi:hypothetical protein